MSCKVLLLDEDATSAEELQIGLRELGCEVTLVDVPDMFGASRALARVAKEAFDLLVLSAGSPAMGGGDVCERIKRDARTKSLRIFLIGTEADIRAAEASPRSHPDGYVRRPVDRHALVAEVQKWFPQLTRPAANSQTRLATVPPERPDDGAEDIDEAPLVDWEDRPGAESHRPKTTGADATKLTDALAEVQRLLDRERATHASNVIRGRHALVTARAAKHAATRKAEARRELAANSLLELEHARQELAQHGREKRAAIDAIVRDQEQTLGLMKAAHDEERSRTAARLAETSARRDDLARQLGQAQARAGSVADAAAAEHEGRRAELEAQLAEAQTLAEAAATASSAKIATLESDLRAQLDAHATRTQTLEQEIERSRAALEELRVEGAAAATASAEESEARRDAVVAALEQERARAGTLEQGLRSSDAARGELAAIHQRTAAELDAERKGHADALESARALHAELVAAHEREIARARGAENELSALRALREAEAKEHRETAAHTLEDHQQALARERALLVAEKAARTQVEVTRGEIEAARAELEAAHADDIAQLQATRALQRAAEEAVAALRVAHADELTALDESVDRMLEQERGAAATLLDETRRAAVDAVALGVAEAQRAARAAHAEAQREAKAELTDALAAHDQARDAALAEETARAAALLDMTERRDEERHARAIAERDDEGVRARALADDLASAKASADELTRDRDALRRTLDAERVEHEADVSQARADDETRAHAADEKLAQLDAQRVEVVADRDAQLAEKHALEAKLHAADMALAEVTRAQTRLTTAFDAAGAEHATALARTLAEAREQARRTDESQRAALEAEHATHAATLARAEEAASERQRLLEASLAEVRARLDDVTGERDERATRLDALVQDLQASLGAQGREHEAAREAQRARHEASLEAQRAEHHASLEAQRVQHETALTTERAEHASVVARIETDAADSLCAANEATSALNARYATVVAERDGASARALALESALRASDTANDETARERQTLTRALDEERSAYASALAKAANDVSAYASAAEQGLDAERARHAELLSRRGEEAENLLAASATRLRELDARHLQSVQESDARIATVEASLATVTIALEATRGERDALATALEAQRAERQTERERSANEARELSHARDVARENERVLAESLLASTEAQLGARYAELLTDRDATAAKAAAREMALIADRDEAGAKAIALERELEASRAVQADLARDRDHLDRDLEAQKASHAALTDRSAAEARERVRAAEAKIAEFETRHAADLGSATVEQEAKRRRELADERDRQGARRRELEAEHASASKAQDAAHATATATLAATHAEELADVLATRDSAHAEALAVRDAAHTESVARLEAAHTTALADVQRALAEQTALAEAVGAKQSGALAAHEELVKGLRKELGSALGALAAERQRRAMEAVHGKALEKKRSSGNHRAVKPDATLEERPTPPPPPPNVPRMSGERTVSHADPRTVLRNILARALGGEAQAELVLAAVLGAANTKELPIHGDGLLAVLERYLHSELRGQIGEKQAHAVMDELAEALVARVTRRPQRDEDDGAYRLTTRPPPPDDGPITKDLERPVIPPEPRPVRGAGPRSVLVIDKDRMARANVSRALAREGCEITVRDSCANIGQGAEEFDVIVTEIVDVAIEELVKAFSRGRAPCPVVAWTTSVDAAQVMLESAGVGPFSVVVKVARADALVAVIRATIGATPGVARG